MKKLLLLIIVIFSLHVSSLSQGCLPEGIIFTTQSQVDNFQQYYPGCTQIEGNVMIGDINGTSNITNLNGLSVLTSIDGRLSIGKINTIMPLPYLTSLSGLENLTSIGESLVIFSLPLTDLTGLEGLTSIGDSLYLAQNLFLTSLTGLNNLISVGGGVYIGHGENPWWDNPELSSLNGLENLTTIGGKLFIGNTALTNLTGLTSLTSIGDDLLIGGEYGPWNPFLTSLTGLENLTSIGDEIVIYKNEALTSLTGLDNIDPGSINKLSIEWNDQLSICDVQSICEYLASPWAWIDIHDNATGCDNKFEVITACGVEVGVNESIETENQLLLYPNPASNKFTFSFTLNQSEPVILELTNQLGKVVATILDESMPEGQHQVTWNTRGLPAGIYFYRLMADKQSSKGKMVVVR